jgi:hypothetical protein
MRRATCTPAYSVPRSLCVSYSRGSIGHRHS